MKKSLKISFGLLIGILVTSLQFSTFAIAANPIKLIVNGVELKSEVEPQIINGSMMVPARALAEALGATVIWDAVNNAVFINNSPGINTISDINSDVSDNIVETTFNGMNAIAVNGQRYFLVADYYHLLHEKNVNNDSDFNIKGQTIIIKFNGITTIIDLTNSNNAQLYKGRYYINEKYYQLSTYNP